MQPSCHVNEVLLAVFDLHISEFPLHLRSNLTSTELVLSDLEGYIGNDESNYDFKSYDEVLEQNSEEDNVSSSPVIGVSLAHVSDQNRLFFRKEIVKILNYTR